MAIVEPLRGLAALAVCWYHFTTAASVFPPGPVRRSGTYGWLGVECFFVISAFVIPLSMYRGGFELRTGWRTFLAKRVTRLDPPYLVAVAASVVLLYASARAPGFAGRPPAVSVRQLLAHLGYLNAFLGYGWLNPVFWTLAIEFQFYLLIALVYAGIAARDAWARVAAVVGLGALGLAPTPEAYVVHFLTIFALGIATFQHHVGLIGARTYAALLLLLAALSAVALGPAVAAAAVATALVIAFGRVRVPRVLQFFGTISYSLYLLHVPVGTRVVSLGGRVAHGAAAQVVVTLGALAVSVGAASLMYRWVERPARLWSASFRYQLQQPSPLTKVPT
ncbi:MAG TPA: acyltransferase [Gemmatirosa sp.]